MTDCDPHEIAAYERVRQRIRALAVQHPRILDVSIVLKERFCPTCSKKRVVEQPPYHCRCLHCGATWELPRVAWPSRSRAYRSIS